MAIQISTGESVGDGRSGSEDQFPIHGKGGQIIGTLEEWLLYAPPKGGASQWREGRSAMELARRWLPGYIPQEVRHLLDGSDAFCFHKYGLTEEETAYVLDPKAVYAEDFPSEAFRVLKDNERKKYGEYRTRRLVLDYYAF